ncbi:MAG: RyR domain-containing protein [bacterium]
MLDEALICDLAEQIHNAYLASNETGNTPMTLPWADLAPATRASNVSTVRGFVRRLQALGFDVTPMGFRSVSTANLAPFSALLAEIGHLSWLHRHQAEGWEYSPVARDPGVKVHPNLVPWEILPERERKKEFELVQRLPEYFEGAGYAVCDAAEFPPSDLREDILERLAEGLHRRYLEQRIEVHETVFDNAALRPWESLSEPWKAANRAAAARVGLLLDAAGLALSDGPRGEATSIDPADWEHCVAPLAEAWHRQWLLERAATGWRHADGPKNPTARTHPDLVDWSVLPVAAKDKARAQVRELPDVVQSVGLTITRELPDVAEPGG